tara:strand:- start:1671 stop:1937 length:267 start_codon:yes stop_codon:yes gene_type:complete
MIDLNEVYMDSTGSWALRKISINPRKVVVVKENTTYASLVSEGKSKVPPVFRDFCTIILEGREVVVVGEINELRHTIKHFGKKGLIYG